MNQILADVFSDVLGFDGTLCDELTPADVDGWDSVSHISMVEELETQFNVKFSTEEMVDMTDVATIKRVLMKHGIGEAVG
jgi:acyl carrier protein